MPSLMPRTPLYGAIIAAAAFALYAAGRRCFADCMRRCRHAFFFFLRLRCAAYAMPLAATGYAFFRCRCFTPMLLPLYATADAMLMLPARRCCRATALLLLAPHYAAAY